MHATQFLKEKGRMVFVIPSIFLDVNYGVALKKFLYQNFGVVAIILFPEGRLLFSKVLTTTCIVLLEKQKDEEGIISLLKPDLPANPKELLNAIKNPSNLSMRKAWFTVSRLRQDSLDPTEKWNHRLDPHTRNEKGLPHGNTTSSQ